MHPQSAGKNKKTPLKKTHLKLLGMPLKISLFDDSNFKKINLKIFI